MSKNMDVAPSSRAPASAGRSLGYFPAVDGLRAIAVLTVMLFHLDKSLLPGGFIGVDVFFVISGFVVTASLAHLHFPTFSGLLAYFYARRLTRIMPALCVCLLATIAVYVLLIPSSWLGKLTEHTAVSAFLGVSNIVLALNNDSYFAPSSEYNPFLHTWSLGVEEQFYLIFPFLLYFHGKLRANARAEVRSIALVMVLGLISLVCCAVFSEIGQKYAFYLLPSRFWELALGMVLALTFPKWSERFGSLDALAFNGLVLVAILLLGYSVVNLDEARFPYPYAVLPALGAALLIAVASAGRVHPVNRLLASRPFVWIGLRSYSLYLWHWPIFVMMRWTSGLDGVLYQTVALALTFVFGHLSYSMVEQPFRRSGFLRGLARWKVAIGGLAIAGVATVSGSTLLKGQPVLSLSQASRGEWQVTESSPLLPGPKGCAIAENKRLLADGSVTTWTRIACRPLRPAGRLFVIGNSHALAYAPMLKQFALDTGHEVRLYFRTECPYLGLNEAMAGLAHCRAFLRDARREFLAQLSPADVLFMPSMRLDQGTNQWGAKTRSFTDSERRTMAIQEARGMLKELAEKTGARLIFEAPKPLMPSPVYRCVDWYTATNPICENGLSISRAAALATRSTVMRIMRDLVAKNARIGIWDPLPILCKGNRCSAFDGKDPIYFDRHHVSLHANRMLRAEFDKDFRRWFANA